MLNLKIAESSHIVINIHFPLHLYEISVNEIFFAVFAFFSYLHRKKNRQRRLCDEPVAIP